MHSRLASCSALACFLLFLAVSATAQINSIGGSFEVYTEPGGGPTSALMAASDGYLYGTSDNAIWRYAPQGAPLGVNSSGTLSPNPNVLHSVEGGDDLGQYSSLVQGNDGALYGTSPVGGANGQGMVFRLDLAGNFSILYSFCSLANCADGLQPAQPLITGTDGNFYGVTSAGVADVNGTNAISGGTIFRLTPASVLTTLYLGCAPGANPCAEEGAPSSALLQASDGNFYGVSSYGGGAIFQLTPAGVFRTIASLCPSGTSCIDGGAGPSTLIEGAGHTLYGYVSSIYGNAPPFSFSVSSTGVFTQLFPFCFDAEYPDNCPNGNFAANPTGPLFLAGDGNIYGTAQTGGDGYGTLYNFSGQVVAPFDQFLASAAAPTNGVLQDQSGALDGYAEEGGDGYGGLYGLSLGSGPTIIPAAVQLTPRSANLLAGQSVKLSWIVRNAVSATMANCIARVNNVAVSNVSPTGSYTYTPPADGTYLAAITCGGIETATSAIVVTTSPVATKTFFLPGLLFQNNYELSVGVVKSGEVAGLPTGTVTILANGAPLTTISLQGEFNNASGRLPALANGSYTLAARYNGDRGDLPSTSAPSTLSVSGNTYGLLTDAVDQNPFTGAVNVRLSYQLTNTASTTQPTGTVTFSYSGNVLATVAVSHGNATYDAISSPIKAGTYRVTAAYSGDANDAPLTSTLAVTVP